METLSFILGIAFVVVIATAIVAVYAFVKVISVQKSNKELDQRFADVYQTMAEESRQINQRVDHFEKDIYSQLDSRLDKLVDNLKKQKALI
jgi:predicted PurR-regulated permease PerM